MVDCPFCQMPYMEWRMDENTSKSKLWDTNMNFWHKCQNKLQQKKEQAEKLDLWYQNWKTRWKYKVPIWCYACNKSYPYTDVCQHIRADGFIEGKDTCEFYADSYSARQRRDAIRRKRMIDTDLENVEEEIQENLF